MSPRKLDDIFRMVVEGRVGTGKGLVWVCPLCSARLQTRNSFVDLDRKALGHCLVHNCFADTVGQRTELPEPQPQPV